MDAENAQERADALEMVEAAERIAGLMLQQQKARIVELADAYARLEAEARELRVALEEIYRTALAMNVVARKTPIDPRWLVDASDAILSLARAALAGEGETDG